MKVAICFCLFFAVAVSGQLLPPRVFPGFFPWIPFPLGFPQRFGEDVYAASLGGAKVGLYGRNQGPYGSGFPGFPFGGPYGQSSDVTGASLGGAKVGLYGKERP